MTSGHVSKGNKCKKKKNLFMSIRLMKKKYQVPITSLSLHWAIYWQSCLHFCTTVLLTSSEHAKCTFIIYYCICFPLCTHKLYFNAAKFLIKQFSLINLTVSVVRQQNEYEIVTETRSIRLDYITSSTFQDVNLHKNPDNRAVVWWNQSCT